MNMYNDELIKFYKMLRHIHKSRTQDIIVLNEKTIIQMLSCLEELGQFRKIKELGYKE